MGSWERSSGVLISDTSLYLTLIPGHRESSNVLEEKKKQLECIFSKRRTQTTSLLLPKTLEEPASIQLCNSWIEVLLKRKYEYYLTQSCVSV